MSDPSADVVDRLERLAAHAPRGGVDPDALWARGRRRQGRRWAVVAASVVTIGLLGSTVAAGLVDRSRTIAPADPDSAMVLPETLRQPGGWDSAFPEAPGRLSAVGIGEAFSWRTLSRTGPFWAVSATTGESGFLDLPDLAGVADTPALSADGRLLAYWATGDVGGDPVVNGAKFESGEEAAPVVGVAVLDLETGEREVWEIASTHGLFTGGMAWAGDVLWWWAGPFREVNGTFGGEPLAHTWDARTGERDASVEDAGPPVGWSGWGDAPGGFVEQQRPRRLRWVTATGSSRIRLVLPDGTPDDAGLSDRALSTDGSRIAVLAPSGPDQYDDLQSVLAGDVVNGVARLEKVGGLETRDIAGWRSPTEVVVIEDAGPREGRAPRGIAAWSVDVTSGDRTQLIDFDVDNTPSVAADAWAATAVPAPRGPVVLSTSPLLGGAAAVLSLVLMASWRGARSRRGHP